MGYIESIKFQAQIVNSTPEISKSNCNSEKEKPHKNVRLF